MAKVVISHRLHDDGMAVLENAGVDVVITNSGDPKVMLPELKRCGWGYYSDWLY